MPHLIVFVSIYVVVANFLYAGLQIWLLQRRRPWPRALGAAIFVWAFLMSAFFLLEVFEPPGWKVFMRDYLYFPMAIEMVWNVLMIQVLAPLMIIVTLAVRRMSAVPLSQPLDADGISRRRFLYLAGCGAAPVAALGLGIHGMETRYDLRMRAFDIPVANLPPELEGITIAHVSDLHSGLFVGPERLKVMSDLANDLKADIVVVTGDLINRDMDEFPAALAAIRRIGSRYGMFLCEGNHDTFPGTRLVVDACRENQLAMLWNQTAPLIIRGRRILFGGLPWMNPPPGTPPEIVSRLFPAREEGDVRVLLAHHPHFFDVAQDVDLLLSGHTHGGQIMFGDVGLGNLRFKYNSGRYHRGDMTMIVNNGCGDWFPCRIGAPAEVGLLKLTKA
jgi:predicted MPP superfamily phosphohydrolase